MTDVIGELTAVPRRFPTSPSMRRRTLLIVGLLVVAILVGLLGLAVAGSTRSKLAKASALRPNFEGFAAQAASAWLAGRPTVLPVAQGLKSDLGRVVPSNANGPIAPAPPAFDVYSLDFTNATYGAGSTKTVKRTWVVDHFTATTSAGTFKVNVTVIDTPSGPVLGAYPSLAPLTVANGSNVPALDYQTLYKTVQPPQSVQAQVAAWAKAYVSNDQAELYTLTGDPASATFAGIGGWKLAGTPQVVSYVVGKTTALARVQVTMSMVSKPAVSATSGYDLLIGNLGNALPNIWAWGPAGSGLSLGRYANAVSGTAVSGGHH
ncbi:MAG: hypothetical protein ACRD0J_03525 [Acidimicrobiales bacterium]